MKGDPMIANVLVGLVALIHLYIVVLEMFLWTTPYGRKVFGNTAEFATASKVLAANQGLYNGFLAAGLIWGLSMGAAGRPVQLFFLGCVIVAGLYGAMSVGIKILFVQALPAALAVAAILLGL
jgi:putative membrane protein